MANEELEVIPEPTLELQPSNPMGLLTLALKHGSGIDVIERLAALHERARDYQAKVDFDEALNRCQAKVQRISANAENSHTSSRYATYARLDKVVRPIYTGEGFSLSFGERDCPTPGKTRFVAFLSRSGVTREYLKDMTPSTKGPQGKEMMTPIHADASADSYAKRYLLKDIFNIAIGEDDNDGNGEADPNWLHDQLAEIARCETVEGLMAAFQTAATVALEEIKDIKAYNALKAAKNARKKELQ